MWKPGVFLCFICVVSICVSQDITYTIEEEKPADTNLGNVADNINLGETLTEEEFRSLRYSFLSPDISDIFKINDTTSVLSTAQVLDREILCRFVANCGFNFSLAAKSTVGDYLRKIKVQVILKDINDNTPTFEEKKISKEFLENSDTGYLTFVGAVDNDSGNNSVQTYRLLPENSPFRVEFEANPDGTSSVRVVISQELDREMKDFYRLLVLAEDGGQPKETGTLTVDITVLDVNDHRPLFASQVYSVSVEEDIPVDTVIVRTSATDLDIGQNGEIFYRLSPHQPEATRSLFAINETTGALSIIRQLYSEPGKVYKVYIEASDSAVEPLISQAVVNVNVLDSNNNAPAITINLFSKLNYTVVTELANIGLPVAHIAVADADTGRNGIINCSLIGTNPFELQRFDVNEYKVVLSWPLDREAAAQHRVRVFCRDMGTPPMNSTASFLVKVADENDNPPVFTKQTYFVNVSEGNEIGQSLLVVTAKDADRDQNAEITYSLGPVDNFPFHIHPKTGNLSAWFTLDRENISQIMFTVVATDAGSTPMTGTCTIVLQILDINDNSPEFTQTEFEFNVLENQGENFTVGRVSATDRDEGRNKLLTFSIAPGSLSSLPFRVYTDGTIETTRKLDREEKNRYDFTVMASDKGYEPQTSFVRVTVYVLDQNDHDPVIEFPNDWNFTVVVSYLTPRRTVVTVIKAGDKDDGKNSKLTYSFQDQNASGLFSIDSISGEIYLVRTLDVSDINTYTFKILVTDQGTSPRSSDKSLSISVTFEEPPSFYKPDKSLPKNFVIAICIACVTVVLSAALIVAIFLIRRTDKKRLLVKKMVEDGKADDSVVGEKKVSFSLDLTSSSTDSVSGRTNGTEIFHIPLIDPDRIEMNSKYHGR